MILDSFLFWVRKYEDFDGHPRMCKDGFVRLGYGRNIDDKGITVGEANLMLENDLSIINYALNSFGWYRDIPNLVQGAIIHLCYIMTMDKVLSMDNFIDCLKKLDYAGAAKAILDLNNSLEVPKYDARLKDIALTISECHQKYDSAS